MPVRLLRQRFAAGCYLLDFLEFAILKMAGESGVPLKRRLLA